MAIQSGYGLRDRSRIAMVSYNPIKHANADDMKNTATHFFVEREPQDGSCC